MKPNRAMRRQLARAIERENANRPDRLTAVPREQWPSDTDPRRVQVFWSRDYLVQVFQYQDGVLRISVSRTRMQHDGRWQDGLTWDELQQIKRDIGLGDRYAIEVYPRDRDIVNVANMRHLWVLPEPLAIGWFRGDGSA